MAILVGDGAFAMRAVGTAEYQAELQQIAGDLGPGSQHLCGALLIPDPKNPFDPHAVAVVIASLVIGYLQNDAAPSLKASMRAGGFIAAGCAARIVEDRGRLGVRLDVSRPFNLRPIAKETNAPAPLVREPDRPPPMREPDQFAAPAPPPFAARPAPPPFAARPVPPSVAPPPIPPRLERDRDPPEERAVEDVDLRPSLARRLVMTLLQIIAIAVILAGAYWWLKSLPREATQKAAPTAAPAPQPEPEPAPPVNPVPSPQPEPFKWPDPPPQFQPAPPPTTPTTPPVVTPPVVTPPVTAPAPPPEPQASPPPPPAPKKKKRRKKVDEPGPNAPLKIN
jgi:hypothetical protein